MKFASVELKTRGRLGRKPQLDLVIFKSSENLVLESSGKNYLSHLSSFVDIGCVQLVNIDYKPAYNSHNS